MNDLGRWLRTVVSVFLCLVVQSSLFAQNQPATDGPNEKYKEDAGTAEEFSVDKLLKTDELLRNKQEAQLKNDLDLLQDLKNQREEIFKREKEVIQQKEVVEELIKDLNKRHQNLIQLRDEIKRLLEDKEQRETKNLSKLTKVYGAMESPKAAALITKLDTYIAISILTGLKSRKAAEIMGYIPEEKAFVISGNFHNLWKENLIESAKIDKLVKVFEGVEPTRVAKLIDRYDDAKMVDIFAKMDEKALYRILPHLSKEKTEFLLREFKGLVEKAKSPEKSDKYIRIYSQMDPKDAAMAMSRIDDTQIIMTFTLIDKERYQAIFDNLPTTKKLSLIESYQREFVENRIDRSSYNKMIDFISEIEAKKAAELINDLKQETSASILMKLKQRIAGDILAQVDKKIAEGLTRKVMKNFGK